MSNSGAVASSRRRRSVMMRWNCTLRLARQQDLDVYDVLCHRSQYTGSRVEAVTHRFGRVLFLQQTREVCIE